VEPVHAALVRFRALPRRAHAAVVLVALLMVASPALAAMGGASPPSDELKEDGFAGVAGRPVVPVARATLVAFDPVDLSDDFAYMAAVPFSTFWVEDEGVAVSSPLLFYQEPMASPSEEETALDAGKGVHYFMDDYAVACGGSLASMVTVGLDGLKASELRELWSAEELVQVPDLGAVETAARIAELGWEWSDRAVVAVIDPAVAPTAGRVEGNLSGTLASLPVITGEATGSIEPSFHSANAHPFDVPKGYAYVSASLAWQRIDPLPGLIQRGKELGFHLYAGDVMVALSDQWNAMSGAGDSVSSYVYTPGQWKAEVVYIPTMGVLDLERPPTIMRLYEPADYTLSYSMYAGVDVSVPDVPEAGARAAVFTLRWDDASRDLGLFLRDPTGQEIGSALATGTGGTQTLELPELGAGAYTVSVVALDGSAGSATFDVDYSWEQTMSREEVGGLAAAAQGAVLASEMNAPLLYATPRGLPSETEGALDLLGVREVVLLDLMGRGSAARGAIEGMRGAGPGVDVETVGTYEGAVARVLQQTKRSRSGTQDVVVTTVDPWSYWLTAQDSTNPAGEEWGGRFVGPAAYEAALHACPVLVTETESRLSCAKAYHTVMWTLHTRATVPVGAFYNTGTAVYDALGSLGLDREGRETIVTVADQYDIGTPWDRALVGPSTPGRIAGTPVDCAYWVARGALYPLVVFANPAVDTSLDPTGGMRWVGSVSQRTPLGRLTEVSPSREAKLSSPVTFTWACYLYKFNERASKYWGAKYESADGSIPGESGSDHPWDHGTLPDLSEDVYQTYSEQAGFGEAESAAYAETVENLNRGTIMWVETMHGGSNGGGVVGWWSSTQNTEANPHRGYEEAAGRLMGSSEDPDVLTLGKYTGVDILPCSGPRTDLNILPERHDGVVLAYMNQDPQTYGIYGADLDRDLGNLHSMGMFAGSCSISNTFLHLSLIRHGCVYQVIDPWLTSWYVELGQEVFYRDVGYGELTVGEAYEDAISLIGAEYITQDWFWDHWENIVFFGEPDMKMYTPYDPIPRPDVLGEDLVLEGHSVMSASSHPSDLGASGMWAVVAALGAVMLAVEAYAHLKGRPASPKGRRARAKRAARRAARKAARSRPGPAASSRPGQPS